MTPERWQKVDRLLNQALSKAPEERYAFLALAAGDDEELLSEVQSLLAFHGRKDRILEEPRGAVAADWLRSDEDRLPSSLGHYQLIRELGRGGMGVVYLADDSKLGRQVAIKLLPSEVMTDEVRIRRFYQEARAASALNHPNIITIYEVDHTTIESGEANFIVAEFVDGSTVREICRDGGLKLGEALDLLIQVSAALSAAHQAGIVHRDIKPENIMRRRDGLVKVLDFGLAKLGGDGTSKKDGSFAPVTTQSGMILGTVSYMSPEQARGLEVDHRTDIFSLGAVMYELLTGQEPFQGETSQDVLVALLTETPSPISRFVSGLPSDLAAIVNKALSKSPDERHQSATEIGEALRKTKNDLEFAARLEAHEPSREDVLMKVVGARDRASTPTYGTMREAPATDPTDRAKDTYTPLRAAVHQLRTYALSIALLAALLLGGAMVWWYRSSSHSAPNQIAVLPIINESGDAKMEYLSDSLTEGMIDSLSQLPGMLVTANSAVLRYKGRAVDPREAGKDLHVGALITGRLVPRDSECVLRIEMLRAEDGSRVWGASYPAQPDGLLSLQRVISGEIANVLQVKVSADQERQVARRHSEDSEAYGLYLTGRSLWTKRNPDTTMKALESFEKALEKDPKYALAYVGKSDAYATLGSYRLISAKEASTKSREAVEKALSLDPQLAEAHASLGKILTDFDWDWMGAEREFRLAISLQPNYANAHHWYSTLLANLGRFDEALQEVRRARELDWLSPATITQVGSVLYRARRYDEAIASLRETLQIEPTFIAAHVYLGLCYGMKSQYKEGLEEARRAIELAPNSSDAIALSGFLSGRAGQRAEALKYLGQLEQRSQQGFVPPSSFAVVYNGLGDKDAAFAWLEKAVEDKSPSIRGLKTDAMWDSLRSDPRFDQLLGRSGNGK